MATIDAFGGAIRLVLIIPIYISLQCLYLLLGDCASLESSFSAQELLDMSFLTCSQDSLNARSAYENLETSERLHESQQACMKIILDQKRPWLQGELEKGAICGSAWL